MAKKKFILTPLHLKFCQHYSEYQSATQAYLFAFKNVGYNTAKTEGCKLLKIDEIQEEIEKLQEEFRVQYKQTREGTIRDLIVSAEEAKAMGQFAAYAKLREMVIRMTGYFEADKVDVTTNGENINSIKIEIINTNKDAAETEGE